MQKKRKDNQFIKQAYYQGGNTAFRKFVAENLQYPDEALKNNIEGVVHLKIEIDYKGKVKGVKLMKGVGFGCDEEAIRIIKKAIYEVPANPKKVRVIFHKNVRIQFKKPKEKKPVEKKPVEKTPKVKKTELPSQKSGSLNLEYEFTQKKKKESLVTEIPKKNSYSYTIDFFS